MSNNWKAPRNHIAYILFLIIIPSCRHSNRPQREIIDSKSITDVYSYITHNVDNTSTLIVFDIDNTLIMPPTHLGSDQWFYAEYNKNIQQGLNKKKAIEQILPLNKHLQDNIIMQAIEKNTAPLIQNLQKKDFTVIALTARPTNLADISIRQLKNVGIDFSRSIPYDHPLQLNYNNEVSYQNGIIFCTGKDKGKALVTFLYYIDYQPKKIVFVDDKLKNIHNIERAVCGQDYPFIGLHYTYLENYIKTINKLEVEKELDKFLEKHPLKEPRVKTTSGSFKQCAY